MIPTDRDDAAGRPGRAPTKACSMPSVRALLPAALVLALAFAFQGARGLWEPDEGYYGPVALAMDRSGDWVIPRLHGEPFLDKPPLMYWGMVAGMRLLGRDESGLRAFHALCFAATAALVALLGTRLWDRRDGLRAGLIYATMVLPAIGGNVVTPDTPLTLWTTAAFLCFWQAVAGAPRRAGVWKLLLCAAMGLGFLTKGPAVLVPTSAMVTYLLVRREAGRFFWTPWALPGFALFAVLGLGWHWAMIRTFPGALEFMWENEVWGRLVVDRYRRHPGLSGALSVYAPAFVGGSLPWLALWPALGRRLCVEKGAAGWWSFVRERPRLLFLLCWSACPPVVYVLASSKQFLYLLPVFPALALLTARGVGRWRPATRVDPARGGAGVGLLVAVLLGAKLAAAYLHVGKDARAMWQAIARELPPRSRVVIVQDHYNGIEFYAPAAVGEARVLADPAPFYFQPRSLSDHVYAVARSDRPWAFLLHHDESQIPIRAMFRRAGMRVEEHPLTFGRRLVVCWPP